MAYLNAVIPSIRDVEQIPVVEGNPVRHMQTASFTPINAKLEEELSFIFKHLDGVDNRIDYVDSVRRVDGYPGGGAELIVGDTTCSKVTQETAGWFEEANRASLHVCHVDFTFAVHSDVLISTKRIVDFHVFRHSR